MSLQPDDVVLSPLVAASMAAESKRITSSEMRVFAVMLISFPLGRALRLIPTSERVLRHLFNIWISVAYLNYVFDGPRVLLFLCGSAAATYLIARYIPGECMPWIGMIFSMTMLAISRNDRVFSNVDYLIFNPNLSQPQMMLTMKMISFCWNVRDGRLRLAQLTQSQKDRAISKMPGLIGFTSYILFFPGLFSEPFLEFNEFQQYMNGSIYAKSNSSEYEVGTKVGKRYKSFPGDGTLSGSTLAAVRKGSYGFALFALFYLLSNRYTVDNLIDSNGTNIHGLPSRILILHIVLFTTRIRAYGIWALSEGMFIATGLGYNGVDPLTRQPRWDKIQNADFLVVEFSDSPKQYLRSWNMTVAAWLRHYVYERIRTPGKISGFTERTATLAFSALWHGFQPGFYVSFVGVSVLQFVMKDIRKIRRPSLFASVSNNRSSSHNTTPALLRGLWAVVNWLLCQILLDYAIVPFLAASLTDTFKIWSNLSFYGTAVVIVLLFCTRGGPKVLRSSKSSEDAVSRKGLGRQPPVNGSTLVEKNLNVLVRRSRMGWTSVLLKRMRLEI